MLHIIDRSIRFILLQLIRLYQRFLSPVLPPSCRFVPSCSDYACEVFQRKPLIPGLWLIAKRIMKCNPLHRGGFDPVP